jgi:hypothetical protein
MNVDRTVPDCSVVGWGTLLGDHWEVFQVRAAGNRGAARLFIGGVVAGVTMLGALAAPASASSSGWEAILGGHIRSGAQATHIANLAKAKGFRTHVQRISATNWEAEIFNGGRSRSQAEAVCDRARRVGGLPHCSVEQEFHGNGWG